MARYARGLVLFSSLASVALAADKTRTVDDLFGGDEQIRFRFSSGWLEGQGCLTCYSQPNASKVYDGTWHDGQNSKDGGPTDLEIIFEGNGIQVVGVLAPDSLANFSFVLDNEDAGRFVYPSDIAIPEFQYDVRYYENNTLAYGPHILTMTVQGYNFSGRQGNSLALLDYITIQYDEERWTGSPTASASPSPSPPNNSNSGASTNVGAIAGGVVGGVIGLLVCLGISFLFIRRRRRKQRKLDKLLAVEAYSSSGSPQTPYSSEKSRSSRLEPARPFDPAVSPAETGGVAIHSKHQRANQEAQLRELQQTVDALQAQSSSVSPSSPGTDSPQVPEFPQDAGLVEQIRRLQEEMREIRRQQDAVQEIVAPPMYVEAPGARSG